MINIWHRFNGIAVCTLIVSYTMPKSITRDLFSFYLQIGISISEPSTGQFTETSSIQGRPTRLSTTNVDEISIRLCDINICMVTDQRLCFRYTDGTIPLLSKSKSSFCTCTARFVSDLFKNHSVELLMTRVIYFNMIVRTVHCVSSLRKHAHAMNRDF